MVIPPEDFERTVLLITYASLIVPGVRAVAGGKAVSHSTEAGRLEAAVYVVSKEGCEVCPSL
jgi:hypothetical protein